MKIAVMGAGALGGYFGGRLHQAGHEVWLIARGAHLDALRSDGLRILSPKGDAHLTDIRAAGDPAEVGEADCILFMVKNRDVESAAAALAPMLGPDTFVVTCQNGVSAADRLGAVIGPDRVVPGVARIPGQITAPGTILHAAPGDRLIFGEAEGGSSDRCRRLFDALTEAGTTPVLSENIRHELWNKFCGQTVFASITTLTGLDIGPLRDCEESAALFRAAIDEAYAVGRAVVPDLPDSIPEKAWGFTQSLTRDVHASMLDDLRKGAPIEHEWLSGEVVRLGLAHGIPTPIHATFHALLKPVSDALSQG